VLPGPRIARRRAASPGCSDHVACGVAGRRAAAVGDPCDSAIGAGDDCDAAGAGGPADFLLGSQPPLRSARP